MTMDCSLLVAQMPLSPPGPVPALPNIYDTGYYLHPPFLTYESRHCRAPFLILMRLLPRSVYSISYPWTLEKVSRVLRGPSVAYAGGIVRLSHFLHPLLLWALVRH